MKRFLSIFLSCLLLCSPVYAHSGRTDSSGGHRDNKNASGLGPYHYHCGGHPAHLHPNGVCPYDNTSYAPTAPSTPKTTTPTAPKSTPPVTTPPVIEKPIVLAINGTTISTDAPPVIINDRTLVPVRAILDTMGATVGWSDESKQVTAELGGKTIILSIGNTTAIVNNSFQTLDVPAQIINGRTMVPARFVAENLGATVRWDASSRTVSVTTQQTTPVVKEFDTKTDVYGNVYKGTTVDGTFVGIVAIYLPDGRLVFQGALDELLQPAGYGRLFFGEENPEDSYLEGEFDANIKLQGRGTWHFEGNTWMTADFIDGEVIDGTYYLYHEGTSACLGEITYKNGSIYDVYMYSEE